MTPTIDSKKARDWLASGEAVLIDVREPDEFRGEHIPYAVSLPLASVRDHLAQMELPGDKKVLFQCQRGARGAKACDLARAAGSSQEIYNIDGGIEGWKAAGLPVVSSRAGNSLSIFRQVQIVAGGLIALSVLAGYAGVPAGFAVAGVLGTALFVSGITGWCGLALLLARMPWNRA